MTCLEHTSWSQVHTPLGLRTPSREEGLGSMTARLPEHSVMVDRGQGVSSRWGGEGEGLRLHPPPPAAPSVAACGRMHPEGDLETMSSPGGFSHPGRPVE